MLKHVCIHSENQSKTVKLEVKVEPQTDDSTEETNIQQVIYLIQRIGFRNELFLARIS